VRARLGYRLFEDFSAGVEASTLSDINQEMRRAGLFVRYAWEKGEISVGGGVAGRSWEDTARQAQPYAGVTVLGRF
jgi:Cellulose biosynthesis protein BcsS